MTAQVVDAPVVCRCSVSHALTAATRDRLLDELAVAQRNGQVYLVGQLEQRLGRCFTVVPAQTHAEYVAALERHVAEVEAENAVLRARLAEVSR